MFCVVLCCAVLFCVRVSVRRGDRLTLICGRNASGAMFAASLSAASARFATAPSVSSSSVLSNCSAMMMS